MKKKLLAMVLLLLPVVVMAREFPRGAKYAVIIGGVGMDETYTKKHWEWISTMYDLLTKKLDFAADHVYVLFDDAKSHPDIVKARSTKAEVAKVFAGLADKLKADDLLFVLIVGHGTSDGEVSKINLPGPDVTDQELAQWLKKIKSKYRVIVNTTSASGGFVKSLSAKDTVVITATRSANEKNDTLFPKFFIEAFGSPEADVNKDNAVSLAEAFNYAVKKVEAVYKDAGKIITEHALLDDNGDGVGHTALDAKEGDGLLASSLMLGSSPIAQVAEKTNDPELKRLLAERQGIEQSVNELRSKKDQLPADKYQADLEELLVKLSRVNREIKKRNEVK
jgi:arsenate reductase-like glutaredoxin family protein